MQAQYSIPFCIALACVRDIRDPRTIREDSLADPVVLSLLSKVEVRRGAFAEKRTCRVIVDLASGERLESFIGESASQWRPASDDEVFGKYDMLMRDVPAPTAGLLLERLRSLERQGDLSFFELLRT